MNVSEITLTRTTRVESDTDAYHILSNQFQLDQYISRFGNVEVVWDDEWTVYACLAQMRSVANMKQRKRAIVRDGVPNENNYISAIELCCRVCYITHVRLTFGEWYV